MKSLFFLFLLLNKQAMGNKKKSLLTDKQKEIAQSIKNSQTIFKEDLKLLTSLGRRKVGWKDRDRIANNLLRAYNIMADSVLIHSVKEEPSIKSVCLKNIKKTWFWLKLSFSISGFKKMIKFK